ncbi:hypothetical protein ABTX82_27840 [Streptomyces lavendulae]|uniref:hypothetical protein n=1 Tax=Streptomyces lavendulae TaxID=1914 RepID=UPI003333030F
MTEVALDESEHEIHADELTRAHANALHTFLKGRTQALLAEQTAGTETYRALLSLDTAVDMTYDEVAGCLRHEGDSDRDLRELREAWERLRWFSFPWRGTPGYDDALWPRAKYIPLRAAEARPAVTETAGDDGTEEEPDFSDEEQQEMLQAALRARDVRQKALQQIKAVHGDSDLPPDPEDETIAHRMLGAYFQYYEQIATERNFPAIGEQIALQRQAWTDEGCLTGLGPTWLLKFATEAELNAIAESLQGKGSAEEITQATFERAAVKRWLTSRGHEINEDEVHPQ